MQTATNDPAPRLVIGVGASAGGLKALEQFFDSTAPDDDFAYIVVQHLSPDFKSLMDELLARHTRMKIQSVEPGTELQPNTIYLVHSRQQVAVREHKLVLTERKLGQGVEYPINLLFGSLAREYGPRAVGIVLSGTGSDGSEGLRAMHANGGLVIVQTPESAEFDGMPRNALALGIADYTLAPPEMAAAVASYARDPALRLKGVPPAPVGEFAPIFNHLKLVCGMDFSPYKIAMIDRRIKRRMNMLSCADIADYALRLETTPHESDALYRDLLIGVTEFFRDTEAFDTLREKILRPLFLPGNREEIRVWCAACASGEEAYSLAIIMDELAAEHRYAGRWSIFATDAHRSIVAAAGFGAYPESALQVLSPGRRERYFTLEENGQWRVVPALRQHIVFAPHNILSDPPFTKLDLVTCRNLLIYLGNPAQERAIGLFHYALRAEGALFLGLSESPGRLEEGFDIVDVRTKLYRKAADLRVPLELGVPGTAARALRADNLTLAGTTQISRPLLQVYDDMLARHAPSGYVVSETGELLHCFGIAGRHLAPAAGRAENTLVKKCDGDLRIAIVTLLAGVFKAPAPLAARGVKIETREGPHVVDLTAEVMVRDRAGHSLAFIGVETRGLPPFKDPLPPPAELAVGDILRQRIGVLEQEIVAHRDVLRTTVEELQTANEELQATNEEMVASNEELQATNEELHSVNEELHTVNAELETRNVQLCELNEDIDNLFKSLDVGVLFIDRDLRIRKYNGAVQKIFHLLPQDVGRPLDHISYQLGAQEELIGEVRVALAQGNQSERQHRTRDGTWLLKRVLPFFSGRRTIEGIVLTFTDISEVKRLQHRVELAMESSQLVWWEWDLGNDLLTTHSVGPCILGYEHGPAAAATSLTWLNRTHPDDLPHVRTSLEACVKGRVPTWDIEHRYRAHDGSWVWVAERGRIVESDSAGKALRMVGTTQNIHARRLAAEVQVRDAEVLSRLNEAVVCTDADGLVNYWGARAGETFGIPATAALGRPLLDLFAPETQPLVAGLVQSSPGGEPRQLEWRRDTRWFETQLGSYHTADDRPGLIALTRDVTKRRQENERLQEVEHQLLQSQKMETLGTLAGGIAHDFNNMLAAIIGSADLATRDLGNSHPALVHIDNLRLASQRAAQLVRQILAFSRQGSQALETVAAGKFLQDIQPLLRATLPKTIAIQLSGAGLPCATRVDRTQLQQIILNLCTNAAHAMHQRGGILAVALSTETSPGQQITLTGELPPGDYVKITVTDEGSGIPPEVLPRIFEPFFTTKPVGQGTGLGLAIVHGVVKSHRGGIRVRNRPESGAVFEILLPEVAPEETPLLAKPEEPPAGTGDCIAIVEDETIVAEMQRVMLTHHNYTPVVFNDAHGFLQHLERPDATVPRLVITDQTMPRLTGLEMISILRNRGFHMPVMLISGFSDGACARQAEQLPDVAFLPKPFGRTELLQTVHRLLATRPRSPLA
jgi:two-component system CheB/CheR fusion protein